MKLTETQLPQMYSKALFDQKCIDLAPEHLDKMYDIIFTGVANLLGITKSKDKPTVFTFSKLEGGIAAAAMVQFFENSDANNPGNWSLVWTFDEADIPENAVVIDFSDVKTHSYFRSAAGEKYGLRFDDVAGMIDCLTYALTQLKKWLDENAKEAAETVIEQDGVFKARVKVENGEKVFALEPAGEIKVLIKSDHMIEK